MNFEWEIIWENSGHADEYWWEATSRAKIHGGWLLKHEVNSAAPNTDGSDHEYQNFSRTMIFVEDKNHDWVITYE